VLQQTRQLGERAGLVVLATGLGKTYVSAFDSQPFRRVLFVAHREEILTQALETFRKVRPSARLGLYHGTQKDPHADVLFASIQTLSQDEHLESFDPTHFDDVLVDEFHHASAETYRRVLDHFEPKFLLGLTATPDRTDGANILSLCAGNEVYRADMPRGIEDGQLSAFRYFGIGDPTEYEKIPWRTYTNDRLAATVSIESRAKHILESLDTHAPGRVRALAFCVTTVHADFMANYFSVQGRACAAVYAGSATPRTASLESLARGDLEIVFCVDMFNEGVDIPNIDTVMMLRPTQSSIVWLQQLGRGLRHLPRAILFREIERSPQRIGSRRRRRQAYRRLVRSRTEVVREYSPQLSSRTCARSTGIPRAPMREHAAWNSSCPHWSALSASVSSIASTVGITMTAPSSASACQACRGAHIASVAGIWASCGVSIHRFASSTSSGMSPSFRPRRATYGKSSLSSGGPMRASGASFPAKRTCVTSSMVAGMASARRCAGESQRDPDTKPSQRHPAGSWAGMSRRRRLATVLVGRSALLAREHRCASAVG